MTNNYKINNNTYFFFVNQTENFHEIVYHVVQLQATAHQLLQLI